MMIMRKTNIKKRGPRTKSKADIASTIRLMTEQYGPFGQEPRLPPTEELVFTILSQHTSDINSSRAYRRLMNEFNTLDTVASAEISEIEKAIDATSELFEAPTEFTIPGQTEISARLDWARVMARRAERESLDICAEDSEVLPYLNRLSDLLWTLARWQEGESLLSRDE